MDGGSSMLSGNRAGYEVVLTDLYLFQTINALAVPYLSCPAFHCSSLPMPSLPFPALPFRSLPLPFPSLPFPSLPFPSLPFPPLPLPFFSVSLPPFSVPIVFHLCNPDVCPAALALSPYLLFLPLAHHLSTATTLLYT